MRSSFSFGDAVVRTVLPVGEGPAPGRASVGIVADLRRADCRVLYLRTGRSLWVALDGLRHARREELAGSLEELVRDVIATLGASRLEFAPLGENRHRLMVSHGAVPAEVVDRVRGRLGGRLQRYLIRPQGLHRIETVLEFTTASGPR